MIWSYLQHPNLLPLMGAMVSEKQFVAVSDWMVNGNINEFVEKHPDADRLRLVGSHFLLCVPHITDTQKCSSLWTPPRGLITYIVMV